MAHPNAERIRQGFEAFATGDLETMGRVLADDVVWHTPGQNKYAGTYSGMSDVFQFLSRIGTEAHITNDLHAVLADDEHAVALANSSISVGDRHYEGQAVFVFHMRNGQVTEAWSTNSDQRALDEVYGN